MVGHSGKRESAPALVQALAAGLDEGTLAGAGALTGGASSGDEGGGGGVMVKRDALLQQAIDTGISNKE